MLALATTRQGDRSLVCQAVDRNASDQMSLVAAVGTARGRVEPPLDTAPARAHALPASARPDAAPRQGRGDRMAVGWAPGPHNGQVS